MSSEAQIWGSMMTLEKASVERAILHLSTLGDTDIFPTPFEYRFYVDESQKVVSRLTSMDLSSHTPNSAFECLSPKGGLSFRIAHQLFPIDCLLYTAAVIQIAPKFEMEKLPSDNGPFAYRFIEDDDNPRLFAKSSNYHDWMLHLKEMYDSEEAFSDIKYVIETDISDFYARIYFHRLEHIFDDIEAPNKIRKLIEGIIKATRARQSYGLPVGSSASRILAEALLVDSDKMIVRESERYSRYVDDFRIIVDSRAVLHSVLCKLAEHLMLTEGLSLNAGKTRTYTNIEGVDHVRAKLDTSKNRLFSV